MTDFERVAYYYKQCWANKEQVGTYVFYEKITPTEYETITGDVYTGDIA